MTRFQPNEQGHDDFGGLHRDVPVLVGRRDMLRMMGGVSIAGLLAACGVGSDSTPSSSAAATGETPSPPGSAAAPGEEIPDETEGPFPADGTNGPNILDDDGVVRPDITRSIGLASGIADGVPLTFNLSVVDASTGTPLPGAVVYIWHCTADGRYSIYQIEDENYLRGVQIADEAGRITFASIVPGCYRGRWPHAHLEVYSSIDDATTGTSAIKTSQLALPRADCEVVYADERYGSSAEYLSGLSLAEDGVFEDGWTDQLATVTGTASDGFIASLLIRV